MLKIKLQDESVFEVPEKYCGTWVPIMDYREDVGDVDVYQIGNVEKISLEHLLKWYEHFDVKEGVPQIGEAKICEVSNDENGLPNVKTIKDIKGVNPFNDKQFSKDTDIDLDNVEDINQLACWRLKEYANGNFQDEWTRQWIGSIFNDKYKFYNTFVRDLCYLGCRVPLAIAAYYTAEKIDELKNKGYGDELIKNILDLTTNQWFDNLPELEKMEVDEESSESEEEEE